MDRTRWFFHPIAIFVFSVLALTASLVLYIYWYIEVSAGLADLAQRFNLDKSQMFAAQTWIVILVLSILVAIILLGIFIIFAYYQKSVRLYRMQHNFINNFTHELKTPVTSLNLYLETFLQHELSREDQIKYLHFMLKDVERLSDNTKRILDLARIESKTFGGEFLEENLVNVVTEFCDKNSHLFRDCDITIHNPSAQTFPYFINRALFEMLIMNLITNAIKYNRSDIPKIYVTFLPQKRKLHISFEDSGIGIDKRDLKRIFKKFYQAGRSDDMTARGSGIGLSLVQNIAKIHKGKVTARSKGIGQGSVFTIQLPFKRKV
ncbi:MAG: HAMP domain-containing histidine kinase [Deltaproteobacteria bacterium]|nr:HAMP domain-containing histidine kinase [Deltaproteobacteria bacterium]